jgi:hypothetical protein
MKNGLPRAPLRGVRESETGRILTQPLSISFQDGGEAKIIALRPYPHKIVYASSQVSDEERVQSQSAKARPRDGQKGQEMGVHVSAFCAVFLLVGACTTALSPIGSLTSSLLSSLVELHLPMDLV